MKQHTVSASSRKGLEQRVLALHGPLAQIQSVAQKDSPGIAGFFASRSFVATVEVPEPGDADASVLKPELDRREIAALLEDDTPASDPGLYSGARRRLMAPPVNVPGIDDAPGVVTGAVEPQAAVLRAYVGLLNDPAAAAGVGAQLCGALNPGARPTTGAAAFGLSDGAQLGDMLEELKTLSAIEVIVVVDPSRKTEDTARWIAAVSAAVEITAIVPAPGGAFTQTPGTLHEYGYPVR